jgi:hypothetical protein
MQEDIKLILKTRQVNGECVICGAKIKEHAEPYKDYETINHSEIGNVLVHKIHMKG